VEITFSSLLLLQIFFSVKEVKERKATWDYRRRWCRGTPHRKTTSYGMDWTPRCSV